MQIYKVYDKVFRCEFQLFIGELEDFKKAISRMEGYPGDDQIVPALGYTIDLSGAVAIWLPEFSMENPQNVAALAHELLHAVHIRLYRKCDVEYWLGGNRSLLSRVPDARFSRTNQGRTGLTTFYFQKRKGV